MIALGGHLVTALVEDGNPPSLIVGLTEHSNVPPPLRKRFGYIVHDKTRIPPGYAVYLAKPTVEGAGESSSVPRPFVELPPSLSYLSEGDVVKVDLSAKRLRSLFRRASPNNFFLLTERCDHYCLMCSQPPKKVDDWWLANDMLEAIPHIDRATPFLGITGGEPTLLGDTFLRILRTLKSYLPLTAIHVLSNGKRFSDNVLSDQYAGIQHPNLTVAIPLYSDVPSIHDYVVQCDSAFDETIRGILQLKRRKQRVEIRIVLHKQTSARLEQFAEFIYRNLTFVDHVAFMGLELTGFAKANLADLWIDPIEYKDKLYRATSYLEMRGTNVSIYNHQLCTLDRRSWPLARKSISDWKNEYLAVCDACSVQKDCGGFFSTSTLRRSAGIEPILV